MSSFGQMTVDWSKGMRKLKHKGKQVILQVQDVTAELKVCQGTVDLHKEKKKGLWQKEKELFLPVWEWKLQCKRKLD